MKTFDYIKILGPWKRKEEVPLAFSNFTGKHKSHKKLTFQWVTAVFFVDKLTSLTHQKNRKKKTAVTQWVTAVFLPELPISPADYSKQPSHTGNKFSTRPF